MKIKIIVIFISFLITSSTVLISSVSACTGIMATDGEKILIGCNEDWLHADYNIRFFPAEDGKYGKVLFDHDWPYCAYAWESRKPPELIFPEARTC